jgi:NADH-quinone oxidoreductase subunit N
MTALVVPALLAAGAVGVLIVELLFGAPRRAGIAALAAIAAALVASFAVDTGGAIGDGAFVLDGTAAFFQKLVLVLAGIGVLGSLDHVAQTTPRRQGDYFFLLVVSVLGMTLLAGARDLLLLVLCFELMGIPLYVLATFEKRGGASEAGLKLFLVGAASTGLTLFGLSLLVGIAGGTRLDVIAQAGPAPLLAVGLLLVVAGMAFKLGAVPFHMWVPDTYQGATTPFVAFLSTAPKAAAVAALGRVLFAATPALGATWTPALLAIAGATMVLGTLLAVPQTNLKRLLAYSGVAHIGFLLLGLASGLPALGLVLFYVAAYTLTNAGVFLVAHAVAVADGSGEDLPAYAGLARRQPWLALALLLFLLSLAGIPFVAGFWAKLYVFLAAARAGLWPLVALGALLSVVALFAYLRVAREAYLGAPHRDGRVRVAPPLAAAIVVCLVAIVALGLAPGPLVEAAAEAARSWAG